MKIIQWATGAMGKTCLRAVIDRPDLELVGLYVYGERKAGLDAGEIARRPATGVFATQSIEEILALDADVVIHAARLDPPFERHDGDIQRLLRSGKNVISINGGSFPPFWPQERQARFQAACAEGQTSFMGAGLNPGFGAEKLAVLATGVCSDVNSISLRELVDCRAVKSAPYVFDIIGFGSEPGKVDPNHPDWVPGQTMNALFREVVGCVADRLGWKLDGVKTAHMLRPAQSDLEIAAGVIRAGTTARIDWNWLGIEGGETRVDLGIGWTMEAPAEGEAPPPLWTIRVDGTPSVKLDFDLETPSGWTARTTAEQLGVAGAVINAIPAVIAAPPGLQPAPLATHFHAFRRA
ncbi:hypothetical protein [Maricaulis sp.]|uniref:NAD(P)H-dependent amine dehydrogenase family protein n=1 Tax=Maricaulis sp. TaxID=1486257 RepID=UPI003A95C0A7